MKVIPIWLRFAFCFALLIALRWSVFITAEILGLELTIYGHLNFLAISIIFSWYLIDVCFERRQIYEFWGLYEGRLKLWIRTTRVAIFALLFISAICDAVLTKSKMLQAELQPLQEHTYALIKISETRALIWVCGIALAVIGWIYTNYLKQKADRAGSTLQVLRDQRYKPVIYEDYLKLNRFRNELYKLDDVQKGKPIPLKYFDHKLEDYTQVKDIHNVTLSQLVDRLLNTLDSLALGVRLGQFDAKTVELAFRMRYLKNYNDFFFYICKTTKAQTFKAKNWRERIAKRRFSEHHISTCKTWEHFLWYVWKITILNSDPYEYKYVLMPPRFMSGLDFWQSASKEKFSRPLPYKFMDNGKTKTDNFQSYAVEYYIKPASYYKRDVVSVPVKTIHDDLGETANYTEVGHALQSEEFLKAFNLALSRGEKVTAREDTILQFKLIRNKKPD